MALGSAAELQERDGMCGKSFLFIQPAVSAAVAAGVGSGQRGPHKRVLNLKFAHGPPLSARLNVPRAAAGVPQHTQAPDSRPKPWHSDILGSPNGEVVLGPTTGRAWDKGYEHGIKDTQADKARTRASPKALRHSGPVRREWSRGMEGLQAPH